MNSLGRLQRRSYSEILHGHVRRDDIDVGSLIPVELQSTIPILIHSDQCFYMNRPHRYWAIRTDRYNKQLLLREVRAGRLRQGWGHNALQDLRLIQVEISRGGTWQERLTKEQNAARPNLRMLSSSADSIQLGDRLLLPNLPDDGVFLLAEVSGEYYYQPLSLAKECDVNELGQDYGHVLPVQLITEREISNYADAVSAGIRSTLRTPMRMWNIDGYQDAIERLIAGSRAGIDLSVGASGEARLRRAWRIAVSHATQALREKLGAELDSRFQAAEWEGPIRTVLSKLYPGADIRWVAGPQEHGADIVVQVPNYFGGLPWLILVQVKNYTGELGVAVLEQLRTGFDYYSQEGVLLSLVVMTTAETSSGGFDNERRRLEQEINTPVELVLRKKMIEMLASGLVGELTITADS